MRKIIPITILLVFVFFTNFCKSKKGGDNNTASFSNEQVELKIDVKNGNNELTLKAKSDFMLLIDPGANLSINGKIYTIKGPAIEGYPKYFKNSAPVLIKLPESGKVKAQFVYFVCSKSDETCIRNQADFNINTENGIAIEKN